MDLKTILFFVAIIVAVALFVCILFVYPKVFLKKKVDSRYYPQTIAPNGYITLGREGNLAFTAASFTGHSIFVQRREGVTFVDMSVVCFSNGGKKSVRSYKLHFTSDTPLEVNLPNNLIGLCIVVRQINDQVYSFEEVSEVKTPSILAYSILCGLSVAIALELFAVDFGLGFLWFINEKPMILLYYIGFPVIAALMSIPFFFITKAILKTGNKRG